MAQATTPKEIIIYSDVDGHEPFTDWLHRLKDRQARQRIETRLLRLEQGNYGDCAAVGEGLSELRLFFGPDYRVYFGEDPKNLIVLLCGGDKSAQSRDIVTAKHYWKEYKTHA